MRNPFQVVRDFEAALCEYTGAPFAVAVNSCTSAILLAVACALRWTPMTATEVLERRNDSRWRPKIEIPRRTYVSVPQSIFHAGARPTFRDEEWLGAYQLKPLPIWDSARWFSSNMYRERWIATATPDGVAMKRAPHDWAEEHAMVCVSFHASKTLGLEQGGAILHDDWQADAWLRRARFDGRLEGAAPKDQTDWSVLGWHCYMNPSTAAQGILRLHSLPRHNAPLPNDDYPDVSIMDCFR